MKWLHTNNKKLCIIMSLCLFSHVNKNELHICQTADAFQLRHDSSRVLNPAFDVADSVVSKLSEEDLFSFTTPLYPCPVF